MPPITVQNIIDQSNDYISNYTTGSVDDSSRIRAVNRAIEYVKRRMTLPSDETIFTFDFSQDNIFTNLPVDFNEGLFLLYHKQEYNVPRAKWTYLPYGDLLRVGGNQFTCENYFSWTPINGKMQLVTMGRNLNQGTTLETFDNIGSITGTNNAQNLRIDSNIYAEGNGSLAFDINPAASVLKTATILCPSTDDFTRVLQSNGIFKVNVYLPEDNISEIDLLLMTDANNYYVLSATTFTDGTAFATGLGDISKQVQFTLTGATIVGSPSISNIKYRRFDLVMTAGFGSLIVEDYRLDDFYVMYPDKMDLVYLTSYKGTDSTGVTQKIFLDSVSDICEFGNYVPDMIDVIAYRSALIMVPQVLDNSDFRKMYVDEQEHLMSVFGKSWPRKRVINNGRTILSRPR